MRLPENLETWNLIRYLNEFFPLTIASKTAAYTATLADQVILADATGAAFTVTLPTPVGKKGKPYIVKRLNAGANNVTVGTATGLIDGAATQVLAAQYAKITVISDGTNWQVIA